MRTTQRLEQSSFVAVRDIIVHRFEIDAGTAQLL
jgi:hypothetical protein